MTSHELARQLLEGPDLPVELKVSDPKDTYAGDVGDATVKVGPDSVRIVGWMSSEDESEDESED